MKIMHIGQIIGGLDVYIRNSIKYNPTPDNVYVVVRGKGDAGDPIMRNGKHVKEYYTSLQRDLSVWADLKTLWECYRIVKKEQPDIIHCHSSKGGIIGRTVGWLTGTRTYYTAHAFSFFCTNNKLKRYIFLCIERMTKFKTYLLACSESEREIGIRDVHYCENHALVWHNSVPDANNI